MLNDADANNISYGSMKYLIDDNGYDVYFFFYFNDEKSSDFNSVGIEMILCDDLTVTITQNGTAVDGDSKKYYVDAQMKLSENDGFYCEVRVSFKQGIEPKIFGKVSFIDGNGDYSKYYPFTVEGLNIVTTEPAEDVTKEKTTSKRMQNSASEKTTVKEKTTSQPKTEKANTTKRQEDKTVVYFYEKEVVVSQVYVTVQNTTVLSADIKYEENTTAPQATIKPAETAQISEGITVQKIICIVGAVILIAFGIWAGLSAKKSGKEPRDEEEKTED